jgi:hypothetical protein
MLPAAFNLPRAACTGQDAGLAASAGRSINVLQRQLVPTRATVVDVGSCVDLAPVVGLAIAIREPESTHEHAQLVINEMAIAVCCLA